MLIHFLHLRPKIKSFDIAIFLRQLATLLNAGIPLLKCCEMLANSQAKLNLRLVIINIRYHILSGKSLADSLQIYGQYFDRFTCELIKIGESTGKLESQLLIIASHKEKILQLKKRIFQALLYPCILLITACASICFMFIFIIPQFNELFGQKRSQLPWLTQCIFNVSNFLQLYCLPIVGIFIISLIVVIIIMKKFAHSFSSYQHLPFLKTFYQKIILARFARNLSLIFSAGLPVLDALPLAIRNCQSISLSAFTEPICTQLRSGLPLYRTLAQIPFISPLMLNMLKIGEESGKLELMLMTTAELFETDIEHSLNCLTQLLEPLIMLLLGALIGGLVIGLYLPIFKLGSVL